VPGTNYIVLDPNKGTGVLPTDDELAAPPRRVNPSKRKPRLTLIQRLPGAR
jgi:hypothetical protein